MIDIRYKKYYTKVWATGGQRKRRENKNIQRLLDIFGAPSGDLDYQITVARSRISKITFLFCSLTRLSASPLGSSTPPWAGHRLASFAGAHDMLRRSIPDEGKIVCLLSAHKKRSDVCQIFFGAPSGDRTRDHELKRLLLYH